MNLTKSQVEAIASKVISNRKAARKKLGEQLFEEVKEDCDEKIRQYELLQEEKKRIINQFAEEESRILKEIQNLLNLKGQTTQINYGKLVVVDKLDRIDDFKQVCNSIILESIQCEDVTALINKLSVI